MDFALTALDTVAGSEAGIDLTFKQPDGSPLINAKKKPVGVHILGADSKAYRRLNRALQRTRLTRLQKLTGKLADDDELDLQEKEDIELLAKMTTGWFGVLDSKDKELEFTPEAIVELYTKYPPARRQVDGAIVDVGRFIQPS